MTVSFDEPVEMESIPIRPPEMLINGWDHLRRSNILYNPNTATSGWIWSRPVIVTIASISFARKKYLLLR
jgi:N-acetylmuramoyl-L-alanine amidase